MKKRYVFLSLAAIILFQFCGEKNTAPSKQLVDELKLKRGELIACGAPGIQLGKAGMKITCLEESRQDFNLALQLLHSFEYEESEKMFAKVIDQDPACAMAYWGVAMSSFHPLWTAPTPDELTKGEKAIQIAKSFKTTPEEAEYIAAIASFYKNWQKTDHRTRCLNFEKGMKKLYDDQPGDVEAAVFYALSLDAAADPNDKSFQKQKQAGEILNSLYLKFPNHPGVVHYIIHTYDYPALAKQGLEAARKYASVAPSSAHALHMPSHIFTRLGFWKECIQSNTVSVNAAKCYAASAGIKGHWDEELHGLDYLMYAYLQKGDNDSAKMQLDYLKSITEVHPVNFKVAYAFAAIPSRYVLENHMWKEAETLEVTPANFSWKNYPWQEAIIHFTKALGAAHCRNFKSAEEELQQLNRIHDTLVNQKDMYKAGQVAIQAKSVQAWISLENNKFNEALAMMQTAADLEDKTEKHPVTPGEVLPARELLGDMLLHLNKPANALEAYKSTLEKHPNRFNTLYGAGLAAEKTGDKEMAQFYFQQLSKVISNTKSNRPEMNKIRQYAKL